VLKGKASAFQFEVVSSALVSTKGFDMVSDWGVICGFPQPSIPGV
jgi:hypothetical protein